MAEHTPGPWRIVPGLKPESLFVTREPRVNGLAQVICELPDSEEYSALPDARLIAAAPRMYNYIAEEAKIGSHVARAILEEIAGTSGRAATL